MKRFRSLILTLFVASACCLCSIASLIDSKIDNSDKIITTSTKYFSKSTIPSLSKPTDKILKVPTLAPTKKYYGEAVVAVNLCNIRSGPSTDYLIINNGSKGDRFKVYGTNVNKTWLLIDRSESIWISLSVVSLLNELSDIPVINDIDSLPGYQVPIIPTQRYEEIIEPTIMQNYPTQTPEPTNCHPSYPDVCIAYPPPDLDCNNIPFRNFKVIGSDPHRFDGDNDGWGCER